MHGMVWYAALWHIYDMVWHGMVQYGALWRIYDEQIAGRPDPDSWLPIQHQSFLHNFTLLSDHGCFMFRGRVKDFTWNFWKRERSLHHEDQLLEVKEKQHRKRQFTGKSGMLQQNHLRSIWLNWKIAGFGSANVGLSSNIIPYHSTGCIYVLCWHQLVIKWSLLIFCAYFTQLDKPVRFQIHCRKGQKVAAVTVWWFWLRVASDRDLPGTVTQWNHSDTVG